MAEKRDIYSDKWNDILKEIERVKKEQISQANKDFILQFHANLCTIGVGSKRIVKLSSQARKLCRITGKDLARLTSEDLNQIVAQIRRTEHTTMPTHGGGRPRVKKLSEATKKDYLRLIRQIFKWWEDEDPRLNGTDEERKEAINFYKALKKVKIGQDHAQIDPAEIITDDDVDCVISGCRSLKERALLKILHETGCRAGEILNVRIRDLEVRDNTGIIHVDGKTGRRAVPLVSSMPYLVQWLAIHPHRNDMNALMWTGENLREMHKPIRYTGLSRILIRAFGRVGLTKRKNPHWFRHSRASILAPHVTEAVLCKFMGWTMGSKQVRCYVHMSSKQVEDAVFQYKGLQKNKDEPMLKDQLCGRCGMINPPIGRYCVKCGCALSVAVAANDADVLREETNNTIKALMRIVQNPKLLADFEAFKKEQGRKT